MEHFYNTTNLIGVELKEQIVNADTQRKCILDLFDKNKDKELTPFEVLKLTNYNCINSIRRAMTNLTKEGVLIKTDTKKLGDFGKWNYCWKLNNENN